MAAQPFEGVDWKTILLLTETSRRKEADQITYTFVETIVGSERQCDCLMLYNIPVVRSTISMLKQQIQELNMECTELRKKVEASRTKLRATNHLLFCVPFQLT